MSVEEAQKKEDPMTYKYIKILRHSLSPTGAWPVLEFGATKEHWIFRFQRKFIPCLSSTAVIGQINFLYQFRKDMDFNTMIHCYLILFIGMMSTCRNALFNFRGYSKTIGSFFKTFHLAHHVHKGNSYKEMNTVVNKISDYFTIYMSCLLWPSALVFNVAPITANIFSGAYKNIGKNDSVPMEFSVYYIYPGFNPWDSYIFVHCVNFYLSLFCAIGICVIDVLLYIMVFQIIGHILVLQSNLKSFPRPAKHTTIQYNTNGEQIPLEVEIFDEAENKMAHDYLVESVRHHLLITFFTDELSSFFGSMLGINYTFQLVSCCLLLLQLAQGDTANKVRFAPISVVIFGQLMQVSIIFEIVNTVSNNLTDAVYYIPWECMNTRNRRTMSIFLHRLQTPIKVTAMGLTTVGVTTMATVLKTTISYFALLQSFDN